MDRRRGTDGNWAAYGACLLAAAYAVVSFYWAFGGTAGIGTLGGRLEELGRRGDPAVVWLAGVAGVLKGAGAVVLVGYGALTGVVGGLGLGGGVAAPGAADRGALWWHVLVWDLWFLVWGVLLGMAAWRYGRVTAAGAPRGRGLRGGG